MKTVWHGLAAEILTAAWFISIASGIVLVYRQLSATEIDNTTMLAGMCMLLLAIPAYLGIKTLRARWELDVRLPDPIQSIRARAYDGDISRGRWSGAPSGAPRAPFWPMAFVRTAGWFSVSVIVFYFLLALFDDAKGTWLHWSSFAALLVIWAVLYRIALRRAFGVGGKAS